jgi:hypothetical protein
MKKVILFVLLACATTGYAQYLKVESKTIKNEEGNELDAWVAHLDQLPEECMESYDDFIEKVFDKKTEKINKTLRVVARTQFHELSNLRIDQRAFFIAESAGTAVAFTFSPGYDVHFGTKTYTEEFANAERFVKSYVKFHYKDFYNKKVTALQRTIKEKQDEIASNDKRIEKNKKSILDNNKDIDKGGSDAGKLKLKNESMEKENLSLTGDVSKARAEITVMQEQLTKLNESLQKVEEF